MVVLVVQVTSSRAPPTSIEPPLRQLHEYLYFFTLFLGHKQALKCGQINTHTCVRVRVCVRVSVCVRAHTHTHTRARASTHTHTHRPTLPSTHAYTQILRREYIRRVSARFLLRLPSGRN